MFDKWLSWLCFQPEATFANTCARNPALGMAKRCEASLEQAKIDTFFFFIKNKLGKKTLNKVFENII